MEMNTRLQVEHPVTELVTGLDLVELQVRIAAGERLPFGQEQVRPRGHAVEARVYAEDPSRQFLPTGGRIVLLREPVLQDVRVDSSLQEGAVVGSTYDPMLAKVIAWGEDRSRALHRLDRALAATTVLGVATNIGLLRALLVHPDVLAGQTDTELVERDLDMLADRELPDEVLVAGALRWLAGREPAPGAVDPWDLPGAWRSGTPAWVTWEAEVAGGTLVEARTRGRVSDAEISLNGAAPVRVRAALDGDTLVIDYESRSLRFVCCHDGPTLWLGREGRAWSLTERPVLQVAHERHGSTDGSVRSPMPGTVVAVYTTRGAQVVAGQPLLVVEAMKMEHTVVAPLNGVVVDLHVAASQQVAMDQPLAVIAPEEEDGAARPEEA
jgi:acetyl-CoA/propionyl-CoA carboxylase biotin carboxyl carrier protein